MIERPIDTLCYDIIDNKHAAILSLEKVTEGQVQSLPRFHGNKIRKSEKKNIF